MSTEAVQGETLYVLVKCYTVEVTGARLISWHCQCKCCSISRVLVISGIQKELYIGPFFGYQQEAEAKDLPIHLYCSKISTGRS